QGPCPADCERALRGVVVGEVGLCGASATSRIDQDPSVRVRNARPAWRGTTDRLPPREVSELQVLIVTSAGAASSAVVPVLAAIEAAGMRVRAIDVGNAGGGGSGVADRVRRALLGEGAERRLKRELELTPPDA